MGPLASAIAAAKPTNGNKRLGKFIHGLSFFSKDKTAPQNAISLAITAAGSISSSIASPNASLTPISPNDTPSTQNTSTSIIDNSEVTKRTNRDTDAGQNTQKSSKFSDRIEWLRKDKDDFS